MLCTALGWWCRHTIADTLQDCALTHTFMTTQPAQFMFAFSVCMVILAVAQVLYVSLDCLGVRTAFPFMFSFVQTCFAGALPFCTTTHYAVH